MDIFPKTFLALVSLSVFLSVAAAEAEKFDAFNSDKPFPADAFFPEGKIPRLESLPAGAIPDTLKMYLEEKKRNHEGEKSEILGLGIGYLHFRNGDFDEALDYLSDKADGKYILEDFRLNFEIQTLKGLAQKHIEKKNHTKAIGVLMRINPLGQKLFGSHPESPFTSTLARDLAETDKLLGDANFEIKSYRRSWQAYRRALLREFPDSREFRGGVYLALARTYEAAGDLSKAADVYAYVAANHSSSSRDEIMQFVRKHEKYFQENKIDVGSSLGKYLTQEPAEPVEKKPNGAARPDDAKLAELFENQEFPAFNQAVKSGIYADIFREALFILNGNPGAEATKRAIREINRAIVRFLMENNPWNATLDQLVERYPAQTLSDLALDLWKNLKTDEAAIVYEKIIFRYPLDAESSHKALFFLGRIYEDKKLYDKSLEHYRRLLTQYNSGTYSPTAFMKIPWVKRLQGRFAEAEEDFKNLLDLYGRFARADKAKSPFSISGQHIAAARYWLARTQESQGKFDEKKLQLKKLVDELPFEFYSIASRIELGLPLKEKFAEVPQPLSPRMAGLGEAGRWRLARAERLIAAGFADSGIKELNQVSGSENDPRFAYYLSRLYATAGDYHKSMKLAWDILDKNQQGGDKFVTAELGRALFPKVFMEKVETLAGKYKLDAFFVLSLIRQESAFNSGAVSTANAVGLMQLLPVTAGQVARSLRQPAPNGDQLKDPDVNLPLGIDYLKGLLSAFNNNTIFALASYNAGPNKVKEWIDLRADLGPVEFIESIPYNETRDYVKKILRNYCIYLALYKNREVRDLKEILTIKYD